MIRKWLHTYGIHWWEETGVTLSCLPKRGPFDPPKTGIFINLVCVLCGLTKKEFYS